MPDSVTTTERNVAMDDMPLEIRMQIEAQEKEIAIAEGKSPKNIAWDQFIESEYVYHDFEVAKKHLDEYIGCCLKEIKDIDKICYDLFLGFTQGKNGIKKNAECAEYVISRMSNTKNLEILLEVTSYYSKLKNIQKANPFFYTLYEIYSKGKGVNVDNKKAAEFLKSAIEGENTKQRRDALRELYRKESNADTDEKRLEFAYEKAVNDKIKSAGTDYANYLMEHKQSKKAIPYLIMDGEYKLAYYAINIKKFSSIQNGVKAFHDAPSTDDFKKSLQLMQNRFDDLKTILFAKEPASYSGILWRYIIFSVLYIPYHTFRLSQIAFILALLAVIGISVGLGATYGLDTEKIGIIAVSLILLWGIILLCVDLWRRYKFSKAQELWKMLVPHPQLESRKELFDEEIIKQKRSTVKLAFISGIAITVILGLGIQYIIGSGAQKSLPFFNQHEAEKTSEKEQSTESQKMEQQELANSASKTEGVKQKPRTENTGKVMYKSFSGDNGITFEYPANAVKIEQEEKDASFTTYHIEVSEYVHLWAGIENTSLKSLDEVQKDIWEHVKQINKICEPSGTKCSLETVNDTTIILRWKYIQRSTSISFLHEAKYRYVNNGGKYQRQFTETAFAQDKITESEKETIQHILSSFHIK